MQWMVRYLVYKGIMWGDRHNNTHPASADSSANHITVSGAAAYAKRKQSTWDHMASKSDNIFKYVNSAYKSPLS